MDSKTIPLKWEVKIRIIPSLKKSEIVDGYLFEVCGQKTFVRVLYSTSSFSEKLPDSKGEYAEQTMALKEASKIRKLMIKRMVYQRFFRSIQVVPGRPTLLNPDEVPKKRFVGNVLEIPFPILDVNDSIEESHNFWKSGFKNRTIGCEDEFLRIAGWLQRSKEESDEINSFICSWIGFNGLYGLFNKICCNNAKYKDAEKINHIIDKLVKTGDASRIVNDFSRDLDRLQSCGVKSQSEKTDLGEELNKERQNRGDVRIIEKENNIKIIKIAMKCIY